ncbi:MAG: AraC family transcriptional regulator [Lentimonas sp.]
METFPLELSPQIRKGRYANFSRSTDAGNRLFMVGYEECSPEYIIERKGFPFWTLEFIAGGHGYYQEEKTARRLRHGCVFTYGPGVSQSFGNESERPFRKYFIVCEGAEFPEAWHRAGLRPGEMLTLGAAASLVSVFDQMLDEGQQSDAQTIQVVSGLQEVLLALIARHQRTASGEKTGSRKAYDLAMDILLRDYRSLHALSDLAERSGYTGEYLCRIFKKYHGDSPYQVLLHRKMSAAWLLLRGGQLQVGAVAQEMGYDDQLHFSRVFRKLMGCAPSSVRARE